MLVLDNPLWQATTFRSNTFAVTSGYCVTNGYGAYILPHFIPMREGSGVTS
jgi:hypothetical protein